MDHIPTELLRTFVAVAGSGGFTSAGEVVGRSQPAVSLQMKRLEELVGHRLFHRSGRVLTPTREGETLLRYARKILALNREVLNKLTAPALAGAVRLGIPNEFASSFLPRVLGEFAEVYPSVNLEVVCDLSKNLLARWERRELDLVFALHADAEAAPTGAEGWSEELVWVANPAHAFHSRSPVPLIAAPEGCVYRARMLQALDAAAWSSRIVYTCASFGGIRAGVLAGLGMTVLGRSIVQPPLEIVHPEERLPALPPVQVRLHYDRSGTSPAIARLVEFMSSNLQPYG